MMLQSVVAEWIITCHWKKKCYKNKFIATQSLIKTKGEREREAEPRVYEKLP